LVLSKKVVLTPSGGGAARLDNLFENFAYGISEKDTERKGI
jgi:hypothetical protein